MPSSTIKLVGADTQDLENLQVPRTCEIFTLKIFRIPNTLDIFAIDNMLSNHCRKPIDLENPVGTTNRKIKYRALSYVIMGNELFKKTLERILLKCLGKSEVYLAIYEVHRGSCGDRSKNEMVVVSTWRLLVNHAERLRRLC